MRYHMVIEVNTLWYDKFEVSLLWYDKLEVSTLSYDSIHVMYEGLTRFSYCAK